MIAPHGWPDEVVREYEAIRPLGRGGFASVILAKHKESGALVAMKNVVSITQQQLGYCIRELDILQEMNHPNIIKLIQHWQPNESCAVMAMGYCSGPTLLQLLRYRGALNFTFAQVVLAQLIEAVLYLHSRAVVHRDIKPDNIIITGASFEQEEIWDDNLLNDVINYADLLKKWHLTLIDFGFARALTPDDMKKKPPKQDIAQLDLDASTKRKKKTTTNPKDPDISIGSTRSTSSDLNRSRHLMRKMSALGNRTFAAPEITNQIQNQDLSHHDVFNPTHTLSNNVSYYGLQVDAYAVGRTMLYCFTGAPPNQNVNELIDFENQPLLVIGRWLGCCRKNDDEKGIRYRRVTQIPDEPFHLMKGLLIVNPQQRKTIRMVRRSPYIHQVLQHQEEKEGPQMKREIDYLSFVKNKVNPEKRSLQKSEQHEDGHAH